MSKLTRRPSSVNAAAATADPGRRRVLHAAAGASLALLGAPAIVRAQAGPKIRVGFWPIASGLPFFVAIEKGYFKEAGLDVEPLKFAGAQQVMEAMLSGRADGSANGTGSANLAIGEIAQPGLFKIFCTNPSNAKWVLDEYIVAKDNPAKTIAELKGRKRGVGSRHPERHAVQDDARARRRHRHDGDRAADRPARRGDRGGAGRRVLHARAHGHRRPHERHHARRRGGCGRQVHPRRSAGAVARWLGEPHHRVPEEEPRRRPEIHGGLREGCGVRAHEAGRGAPIPEGLYRDRGTADLGGPARRVHALQRVQAERRRVLPEVLRSLHREGHLRQEARRRPTSSTRRDDGHADDHRRGRAVERHGGARSAAEEAHVGTIAAHRRAAPPVHRVGRGGARGLHQADPAAHAHRHADDAGHGTGRRSAARRFPGDGQAHAGGVSRSRR